MAALHRLYRDNLALLTDLYELTMAYGYWKLGRGERLAAFHLYFREAPFDNGYAVACGLANVVDFLSDFHFTQEDAAYLATLTGSDGRPLFDPAFLDYLCGLRLTCDADAVPEGTVVFPHQPLIRVRGPILQAQLLESALLNLINFPTLVATKAARICQAARGDDVIEFGLRRAQGIDGALTASRAAYVGGCASTSDTLAGKLYGIPIRGTHAHSWVVSFADEPSAFQAWAEAMPNNAVFLVDTYNTLEGVRHAIAAGRWLRERGHKMIGIRLDSGDLAYLSIEARRMLDKAGLNEAAIFASNDLDEQVITSLKDQGATIAAWGVGTRLATAYDQPALGGVYKLAAVQKGETPGAWELKVKVSEDTAKSTTPGILQVRRYHEAARFVADMIYDEAQLGAPAEGEEATIIDPGDPMRRKTIAGGTAYEDLLVPIFLAGRAVYTPPPIAQSRQRTIDQLAGLHPTIKRLLHPHRYPAGLERRLYELRTKLILEARGVKA